MSSLFAYAPRNDAERGFYEYLQASAPYLSEVVLDFVNVLFEMPYKWTMVDVQPMTPEQDGCLLNLERDELLEHVRNGLEKVDLESVIIGQASNTNIGERVVGKTRSEILQAWNQIENSCKTNPFGEGPKTEIDHDHLSIVSHTCNGGDSWNEPRHPSGAQWDYGEFDEDPRNIRFYLTATQAGYVTLPHYDPPLGISHMWHIIGAKLWLVWEDSILNMQKIRETRKKKKSSRKISLLWAINNLSGLKVRLGFFLVFLHLILNAGVFPEAEIGQKQVSTLYDGNRCRPRRGVPSIVRTPLRLPFDARGKGGGKGAHEADHPPRRSRQRDGGLAT